MSDVLQNDKKVIFMIEDNADVLLLNQKVLARRGFATISATSIRNESCKYSLIVFQIPHAIQSRD